eukprot:2354417-Amphidinium_carterae.1
MHHELTERDAPAVTYLELKLDQVEDGEMVAESLQDVTPPMCCVRRRLQLNLWEPAELCLTVR